MSKKDLNILREKVGAEEVHWTSNTAISQGLMSKIAKLCSNGLKVSFSDMVVTMGRKSSE